MAMDRIISNKMIKQKINFEHYFREFSFFREIREICSEMENFPFVTIKQIPSEFLHVEKNCMKSKR